MLAMLKSDYENTLNAPAEIANLHTSCDNRLSKLYHFAINRQLTGFKMFKVAYSLETKEDDSDEEDQLADEGGIIYYNDANEKANSEYNSYRDDQKNAHRYWGKMIDETDVDNLDAKDNPLHNHKLLLLIKRPLNYDYFRTVTEDDVKKASQMVTNMVKATYKPINLSNYYVIIKSDLGGLNLLARNGKVFNILTARVSSDLTYSNNVFNTSVLYTDAQLKKAYTEIADTSFKPFKSIILKQAKDGTVNANILTHV